MSGGTQEERDASWRPRGNRWVIAVVVTLAAFMEVLDTTIVNVSLPHIAGSVAASYDEATWTLTSYLIANGIVLPISGWIGRLVGRKRYFLICIAMFTACSFLCGMATSLGEMIIFRLLQGFFGGGLQPNQQSIILDTFEPAQRGRAFSIVAVAVIVAPIVGPTLGGWITDNYSWRWIFLINLPVGVFTFFAVARLVEDPPWVVREHKYGDKRVDYIGLGLIALGLGCLEVMLDRGEDNDWFGSPSIVMFAFLAFAGIAGAIGWLLYTDKPVVDLRVYADRNFAVGSLVIFAIGAILYSSAVLIPQLAQQHLGYTALLAGLLLSPGALLVVFLIPIVGKVLLPHVQTRYIIAFGFFSLGCALLYAHRLTPNIDFFTLATIRAAQTFGLAFLFVPNSTITYSTLPKELNADASALYTMLRNIAGSVGISLSTAMVAEQTQVHRAYLAEHLTPFSQPYQHLLSQYSETLRSLGESANGALGMINQTLNQQAAILAYLDVFLVCAIAAFCVVPFAFLFRPSISGGEPAGH
ncbi:MAG: DHA2 family efflux MFS transporter permease subunit [Alphaproteobacteria bacterium]|nr:DHA2 family efflux MFS transporter permease subunit [Alphaproteobacteria bacterium]